MNAGVRAFTARSRATVGDPRGEVRPLDQRGVVIGRVDERDRQDVHEAAVALVALAGAAGIDRRRAAAQPAERLARRATDVQHAVAIGRVGGVIGPDEGALALVLGVEPGAQKRVEEGEHQGTIVAPRAGRLMVRAVSTQLDRLDVAPEFVRDADRVTHEVAVPGRRATIIGHGHGRNRGMAP